jgi:hypothetical protein
MEFQRVGNKGLSKLDKRDKEILNYCLLHGLKDIDAGKVALEKFEADEAKRLREEHEAKRVAGERERRLRVIKNLDLEKENGRVAVSINDKRVTYDPKLGGYHCPNCKGKFSSAFEKVDEIASGIWPKFIAGDFTLNPTRNLRSVVIEVMKCSECGKESRVVIQGLLIP